MSKKVLVGVIAAVVAVAAGIVGWRLYSGNAPDQATIGSAVDVVRTDAPDTTDGGGGATLAVGADRTWVVDNTIGQFSFEDATSSFAGFRVKEELRGFGAVEAVGRTPNVTGTITIDGTRLTAASIAAELATITTDRSGRDSAVKRALDTANFPLATFELTGAVDFGSVPNGDDFVSVVATGDLTIKGVTLSATFALDAQFVDGVIVIVGQIPVVFEDFGITVPSAPVLLAAEDEGIIEIQLFLTRRDVEIRECGTGASWAPLPVAAVRCLVLRLDADQCEADEIRAVAVRNGTKVFRTCAEPAPADHDRAATADGCRRRC